MSRRFGIIAAAIFLSQMAMAQTPKSFVTIIDDSFALTAVGDAYTISGKAYHPAVSVHKAVAQGGRLYACVGVAWGAGNRKEFMRKSSLRAANGQTVKRGFFEVADIARAPKVKSCWSNTGKTAICSRLFPADLSLFIGEKIGCQRTNKKLSEALLAGPGTFYVPLNIWVEQ